MLGWERKHALPCKHEDLSLIPEPTYKCQAYLLCQSWGGRNRSVPGAHLPGNLANWWTPDHWEMLSQISMCLSWPTVVSWCSHACSHTYLYIHVHTNTDIQLILKKMLPTLFKVSWELWWHTIFTFLFILYVTCMPGTLGSQKKVLDPTELEL